MQQDCWWVMEDRKQCRDVQPVAVEAGRRHINRDVESQVSCSECRCLETGKTVRLLTTCKRFL
jgi:hypothetical protein